MIMTHKLSEYVKVQNIFSKSFKKKRFNCLSHYSSYLNSTVSYLAFQDSEITVSAWLVNPDDTVSCNPFKVMWNAWVTAPSALLDMTKLYETSISFGWIFSIFTFCYTYISAP